MSDKKCGCEIEQSYYCANCYENLKKQNETLRAFLDGSYCDNYIAQTAGGKGSFHSEHCRKCKANNELKDLE